MHFFVFPLLKCIISNLNVIQKKDEILFQLNVTTFNEIVFAMKFIAVLRIKNLLELYNCVISVAFDIQLKNKVYYELRLIHTLRKEFSYSYYA